MKKTITMEIDILENLNEDESIDLAFDVLSEISVMDVANYLKRHPEMRDIVARYIFVLSKALAK